MHRPAKRFAQGKVELFWKQHPFKTLREKSPACPSATLVCR
jgi:hypothetical protein